MKKWLKALFSAGAAIFGVQSDKNRQDDFENADPKQLVIAGIVVTVAIVLTLIFIVGNVVKNSAL